MQFKRRQPLKPLRAVRTKPSAVTPHPTDPTLALVELTKGHFAVISAIDSPVVAGRYWTTSTAKTGGIYAQTTIAGKLVSLHRFIGNQMGLSLARDVDHENGNGIDCRRSNLRDATRGQNRCNTGLEVRNKSGIKGVSWSKSRSRWEAKVMFKGKRTHLGWFVEKADAAEAVRAARERLHGEFANHGREELH